MKQTKQKCTLTYYSPLLSVVSWRQKENFVGRVSAKTNENSNSNDNSLKSFSKGLTDQQRFASKI